MVCSTPMSFTQGKVTYVSTFQAQFQFYTQTLDDYNDDISIRL